MEQVGLRFILAVGPRRPPFPQRYVEWVGDSARPVDVSFGQQLAVAEELIRRATTDLGAVVMADIDSAANGVRAAQLGCAWVGTTLYGYTETTSGHKPPGWDLLGQLKQELPVGTSLICEGGLASADQALRALGLGANAVVVGTAITGVDLQVAAYVAKIQAG